jgi:hypothetical protein
MGQKFWSSWKPGWQDIIMFNVALKAVGDSFRIAFVSDIKFCHTEFQLLEWSLVIISILHPSHLRSFPASNFISAFCFLSCCKASIVSAESHTVGIATLHLSVFLREVYNRHANCKVSTAHAIWVCLYIVEKWSEMATTTVTEHGQILVALLTERYKPLVADLLSMTRIRLQ